MTNLNSYHSGHPLYYVLGGRILRPKEILDKVKIKGYKGYLEADIKIIDLMNEPQRSEKLRALRISFWETLRSDIRIYRLIARQVRQYNNKVNLSGEELSCQSFHSSISFKHNHIYNDFGHLVYLDSLLSKQTDLFGF